jgi:hypothetical protein
MAGAEDDSAALAIICEDYAEGRTTLTPDWLVETVAAYLSSLDADDHTKVRPRSMQGLPPSRRRRPAKGLFTGVEFVQPAGFGARSSNLPDAGSRRTSSGRRNFARGGRPARPAQAVIPAHRRKAHGDQTNCNVGVQRFARRLARLVRLNKLKQTR